MSNFNAATAVLGVIFSAMIFGFGWWWVCIEKAFRQRCAIIEWVYASPNWVQRRYVLHSVSYREHIVSLFFFQDALGRYGLSETILEPFKAASRAA